MDSKEEVMVLTLLFAGQTGGPCLGYSINRQQAMQFCF